MSKKYRITVNGKTYDVGVEELGGGGAPAPVRAAPQQPAATAPVPPPAASAPSAPPSAGANSVKAPMPGTILGIKVAQGQGVKRGDVLLILEAMKMENEICAPSDGTVAAIRVQTGNTVNTGDPMVDLA